MMNSISKKHINIGGKKIYIQVLGNGPVLALFHPSPHSSDMLLPLAQKLAQSYTVICVDTPGYGNSDGLDAIPEDISIYSNMMNILFTEMGISKLSLYGSATGAQIAIRYALDYQNKVSHVFLDNAAHFDDDLRKRILESYFPDLTPVHDGGHLEAVWDIVSNLFKYFPWCFKTPEFALNRPPLPANVLHAIAMDFLKVGKDYDLAYKVAFMHEKAEYVQKLKVPTTLFRWEGSIILPYVNDLAKHPLGVTIETINLKKDPIERTDTMVANMIGKSVGLTDYKMPSLLGEDYIEPYLEPPTIELPQIVDDGSHLLKAWELIRKQEKIDSPEEIQRKLINGYTSYSN